MIPTADRPRDRGRWLPLAEAQRRGWVRRGDGRWGFCPHLFGPTDPESRRRWWGER